MKMLKPNIILSLVAFMQLGIIFGHEVNPMSILKKTLLDGYEKDAKPDGKIVTKFGMEILSVSLCPYKKVIMQCHISLNLHT